MPGRASGGCSHEAIQRRWSACLADPSGARERRLDQSARAVLSAQHLDDHDDSYGCAPEHAARAPHCRGSVLGRYTSAPDHEPQSCPGDGQNGDYDPLKHVWGRLRSPYRLTIPATPAPTPTAAAPAAHPPRHPSGPKQVWLPTARRGIPLTSVGYTAGAPRDLATLVAAPLDVAIHAIAPAPATGPQRDLLHRHGIVIGYRT